MNSVIIHCSGLSGLLLLLTWQNQPSFLRKHQIVNLMTPNVFAVSQIGLLIGLLWFFRLRMASHA